MIEKVISGGQIGADLAGLIWARSHKIKTGGMMPKGFKNRNGLNPWMKVYFGMVESSSESYKVRTWWNVENSDGTVRFAYNFNSPGERCTFNAIKKFNKPHFDVDMSVHPHSYLMFEWIKNNNIRVLNVAGNARHGMVNEIVRYMDLVFNLMDWDRLNSSTFRQST